MSYEEFIQEIIATRGQFGCGEAYHERHHIKPKCLGGSNDKSNLIDLFAREHFIAHKLLAEENPSNNKLQYAWWCMTNAKNSNQLRESCTPEEYEEAKIAFSKAMSGKNCPNYGKRGSLSPYYGVPRSEEDKKKMRENHSDYSGTNNPFYGRKHTKESRVKISEHHADFKGEKHPNYGKHASLETREKISRNHADVSGENNPWYGKQLPDYVKQKMKDNHADFSGDKHPRCRAVVCIETGTVYWGAKDVQNKLGINKNSVTGCCRGRYKTAGGYHWKYKE